MIASRTRKGCATRFGCAPWGSLPSVLVICAALCAVLCTAALSVSAQSTVTEDGHIPFDSPGTTGPGTLTLPQDVTVSMQILFLMTFLTLIPSLILMMTSFIRISIVLGLLRRALGTQQSPSNQVLLGMSIFLTIFVMSPTLQKVNETAVGPYLEDKEQLRVVKGGLDEYGRVSEADVYPFIMMLRHGLLPIRDFMWQQIRKGEGGKDVALFMHLAKLPKPNVEEDVPTHVLIPAFMISELKKAFTMGFVLFIPFMIVDIVVASILISMGMFQLPPAFLSLPFKILLFVLADGWSLIIRALGLSFAEM